MIKILYDHQKFSVQRYGGISRYFANIVESIKSNPDFDYKIGCLYSPNHYIQHEPQFFNNLLGKTLFHSKLKSKIYDINQHYCNYLLKENDFDIFHPTYYDPYFIGKTKKPIVVTVHDMTHERLPEYFWDEDMLTHHKKLNIEIADKIIAISETTKADLIKYSKVDPNKIEVIYHGIDITTSLVYKTLEGLPSKYLLFVGYRSGYKNFYLFIRAFATIQHKYPEMKIVLAGGGKLAIADLEFLEGLNVLDKVQHIQATDEELNYLYNNATLFVYPSLCEGFGLPILEAFKADCPILLSDTHCFKEIGGDATAFFEAQNMDDLIAQLEKLIGSAQWRNELIEKGKKRLLDFPIEKCVKETLALYQSLM